MFYQIAVTFPILRMKALISLIEKIEPQALERGTDDASILSYRLSADMFPFAKQIQIVSDNAKGMASRLARKENPKYEDDEKTLADLKNRLQKTIDFLSPFTEDDFAEAATAEARFPYFPGTYMVGADYVLTYALPNFTFHVVTAYSILRHHGFEIGKADYMGKDVALVPEQQ